MTWAGCPPQVGSPALGGAGLHLVRRILRPGPLARTVGTRFAGLVAEGLAVDDGDAHVMPRRDLIEHVVDGCPCGPTTEAVERPDGSIVWLVFHHSLDGRKLWEPRL